MPLQFGTFTLDEERRQLLDRAEVVRLQPKAFDLLVYLVRNRDRVLSKSELLDSIWPNEIVSESALSFSIKSIRRALGDMGRTRRFVETAHGRGFRFIAEIETGAKTASAPSRPTHPAAPRAPYHWTTPFVGRESELTKARASVAESLSGNARVCWLSGEPGIGKTRLGSAVLEDAAAQGMQILLGRCHDQSAPSLWPWVQIVRSCLQSVGPEAPEILGPGASDIVRLVPSVRDIVPAVETHPVADVEQARLRLLDSIVELLANAARRRPIAMWLEDLHWADASSLLLFRLCVERLRDLPVFSLASYREAEIDDAHPLRDTLAALRREVSADEIPLLGLTNDQAADLVRSLAETGIDDLWRNRIVDQAEGNPFFLEELCRDHLEGDERTDETEHLPIGVRDTIERRLSRLDPSERDLLSLGATIGRDFEFELLRRASGHDAGFILTALEKSAAISLVSEVQAGRFRFSHALIQEVLRAGVSKLRRAELHLRVAEALAAAQPPADPTALAHHFSRAVPIDGWQRAFAYQRAAGELALEDLRFEDATRLLESALGTHPNLSSLDPEERVSLLTALATAHRHAGNVEAADGRFKDAIEAAREAGLTTRFAEAAMAMRATWALRQDAAAGALTEALTQLDESHGALLARVQSGLAATLYLDGSATEGQRRDLVDRAMAGARKIGDPATLIEILDDAHVALWSPDNVQERLTLAEEQLSIAREHGWPELELRAWNWRIADLAECGEIAQVEEELSGFADMAERYRWPRFRWNALNYHASLAFLRGHLDAAEELVEEGFTLGVSTESALLAHACHLWTIRSEQGRLDEIAPTLIAIGETLPGIIDPAWMQIVAMDLHRFLGDRTAAEEIYRSFAGEDFAELPPADPVNSRLRAISHIASAAEDFEDAAGARLLYEELLPYRGLWIVIGLGSIFLSPTDTWLGVLARTAGDNDAAQRHLRDAIGAADAFGARIPAMRARLKLGEILKEADPAEAATILGDAREAALVVDHSPVVLEADVLLASIPGVR